MNNNMNIDIDVNANANKRCERADPAVLRLHGASLQEA